MCAGEGLLSRKSSGNVYDDFPCVRVGDYDLPSSMDLRQYLDEMQQVGDWEGDPELPTIPDDEVCFLPTPDGQPLFQLIRHAVLRHHMVPHYLADLDHFLGATCDVLEVFLPATCNGQALSSEPPRTIEAVQRHV